MGKIRVATLGNQEEKELAEKQRVRREEKKKREKSEKVHISGMKGGERVKAVGMDEEETERMARLTEEVEKDQREGIKREEKSSSGRKKAKTAKRSKKYSGAAIKVDPTKQYPVGEALPLLRSITLTKFNGTVELHINTVEKGLRGTVPLPHGTGKEVRVKIASSETIDDLLTQIEGGTVDFDALVAHPSVMGKLAKVAKFLGPRGLMPNPKNGTISTTPEKVAEKLKSGEVSWKTESEFPIIHQAIGKMSFKDKELAENFTAFVKSVGEAKIKNITLKSTMSPGIKIGISG